MTIDTSSYYRLTTEVRTDNYSLARRNVVLEAKHVQEPNGDWKVIVAEERPHSGQFWKLVDRGGGNFAIYSAFAGESLFLVCRENGDVILSQDDFIPHWSQSPFGDGSYLIYNDVRWSFSQQYGEYSAILLVLLTGRDIYAPNYGSDVELELGVVREEYPGLCAGVDRVPWGNLYSKYPPPHIRLTKANKVIPDLAGGTGVDLTLGPTDYNRHVEPIGSKRGGMVFIDFSDQPAALIPEAQAILTRIRDNHPDKKKELLASLTEDVKSKVARLSSKARGILVRLNNNARGTLNQRTMEEKRVFLAILTDEDMKGMNAGDPQVARTTLDSLTERAQRITSRESEENRTILVRLTKEDAEWILARDPGEAVKTYAQDIDEALQTLAGNLVNRLFGNYQEHAYFSQLSYGKLTLAVDDTSDLGWQRMPSSWKELTPGGKLAEVQYLKDIASLFYHDPHDPPEAFGDYLETHDFVLIVPTKQANTTWLWEIEEQELRGVRDYRKWNLVNCGLEGFGEDVAQVPYSPLIHEVGHVFGLPDLYGYRNNGELVVQPPPEYTSGTVECWSVMAEHRRSETFLGWERHKMGWLDPFRKIYLCKNTSAWETTLYPLSDDSGLSMIVLSIDDVAQPSKVLVVELAQPVIAWGGNTLLDQGVLLYTVDATIQTGQFPIKIVPNTVSTSPDYGSLFEAPFTKGDAAKDFPNTWFNFPPAYSLALSVNGDIPAANRNSKVLIAVKVLDKIPNPAIQADSTLPRFRYKIRIDYNRQ